MAGQHLSDVNVWGLVARACYRYTTLCYTHAYASLSGDTMDLQKLLTTKQKEEVILAQLGMDTTRDDVVFKYDARYGWDFCVKRISNRVGREGSGRLPDGEPYWRIKVIFSVFITDKRFKAAVREVHRAIHEVRQGRMMVRSKDCEVVLTGNGKKDDLSITIRLDAELGKILREHAYNSGFHPTAAGVKKFLAKTFKGGLT